MFSNVLFPLLVFLYVLSFESAQCADQRQKDGDLNRVTQNLQSLDLNNNNNNNNNNVADDESSSFGTANLSSSSSSSQLVHGRSMPLYPSVSYRGTKVYTVSAVLGSGTWGSVFLVEKRPFIDLPCYVGRCALKLIKINDPKQLESIAGEISALNRVRECENCCALMDYGMIGSSVYLYMPFYSMDLFKMVEEYDMPFEARLTVLKHVAQGLAHSHENNVIHRDLKPENILLDGVTGQWVICDYGLAYVGRRREEPTSKQLLGSLPYMAPEVVHLGYGTTVITPVTTKSDIWSLGVIAFCLLTDQMPFEYVDDEKIKGLGNRAKAKFEIIARTNVKFGLIEDDECRLVIEQMLSANPKNRPTAKDILTSACLAKVTVDVEKEWKGSFIATAQQEPLPDASMTLPVLVHQLVSVNQNPPFFDYLFHKMLVDVVKHVRPIENLPIFEEPRPNELDTFLTPFQVYLESVLFFNGPTTFFLTEHGQMVEMSSGRVSDRKLNILKRLKLHDGTIHGHYGNTAILHHHKFKCTLGEFVPTIHVNEVGMRNSLCADLLIRLLKMRKVGVCFDEVSVNHLGVSPLGSLNFFDYEKAVFTCDAGQYAGLDSVLKFILGTWTMHHKVIEGLNLLLSPERSFDHAKWEKTIENLESLLTHHHVAVHAKVYTGQGQFFDTLIARVNHHMRMGVVHHTSNQETQRNPSKQ